MIQIKYVQAPRDSSETLNGADEQARLPRFNRGNSPVDTAVLRPGGKEQAAMPDFPQMLARNQRQWFIAHLDDSRPGTAAKKFLDFGQQSVYVRNGCSGQRALMMVV